MKYNQDKRGPAPFTGIHTGRIPSSHQQGATTSSSGGVLSRSLSLFLMCMERAKNESDVSDVAISMYLLGRGGSISVQGTTSNA